MIDNIVGYIEDENQCMIGTCFLFCDGYIITARHVIEDYITSISKIKCIFPYINLYVKVSLEFEDEEFDFAVLQYEEKNDIEIEYYELAISEAESGDNWETIGFPVKNEKNSEFVDGTIKRIMNNNPNVRYELKISDVKDDACWQGISGAPLIVEDTLSGIIISEKESNLKSRFEAVSISGIISILKEHRPCVIKNMRSKYDEVLKQRMDYFEEGIKKNFHEIEITEGLIKGSCYVLKNTICAMDNFIEMVGESIRNYGATIIQYKKSKTGTFKERNKADKDMDRIKRKIMNMLQTSDQLAYILLWTLAEGAKRYPRIGSRIIDDMPDIMTDIYVKEDDKLCLYFSCGRIDEEFFECFEKELEQINNSIKNNSLSLEDEIINWDELVVSSLRYNNQELINNRIIEKIEVGIFMMTSYEHYELYRNENINNENNDCQNKKIILERYINNNLTKLENIIAKYDWIKSLNVEHFILPFNDMAQFKFKLNESL